MSNKESVRIISVSLASVSFVTCLVIWWLLNSFEPPYRIPFFSSSGRDFFHSINTWYFIIGVGFFIYISCEFLKLSVVSNAISILSLCVGMYPHWNMLSYKKEILSMETKFPYNYWLNNSIYFDWFLLCASIILMFIQLL